MKPVIFTRRRFGVLASGVLASQAIGGACRLGDESPGNDGRLTVRPIGNVTTSAPGERALGLDSTRDAILRVSAEAASGPLPLLVLLHGAGGSADGVLRHLGPAADAAGVAVLAPDSRGYDVTFREFDGEHEVPAAIAREGMRWVAETRTLGT